MSIWAVRLGAFLLLLSPLFPQYRGNANSYSAVILMGEMTGLASLVEWLGVASWMFAPMAGGAAILACRWRRTAPGPALRTVTLVLLLAVALETSTLGSVLLTQTGVGPQAPPVSFPLSMVLFLSPILLAVIALARVLGGDFERSSGRFTRGALAVLLALNSLFLLDSGWDLLFFWMKEAGTFRALPAASLGPLGGLLVVAGEMLSRPLPRPAMDTVPASG